jgi:hypothetical protein
VRVEIALISQDRKGESLHDVFLLDIIGFLSSKRTGKNVESRYNWWGELLTMQGSTFWMIMIFIGVLLVAWANIEYPHAREKEKRKAAAEQARSLLEPELRRNRQRLDEMSQALDKGNIPLDAFDTTAWQTVSRGELLFGLPSKELSAMMQAYYLANRANALHARLLDGRESALGGWRDTQQVLVSNLKRVVQELEPVLQGLLSS